MSKQLHLVALGYPTTEAAHATIGAFEALGQPGFLKLADWAVVTKDADGKVTLSESKSADAGGRRGAVAGGVVGGVALLMTGGLGFIVAGAALGAAAAALRDAGFKTKDMEGLAERMRPGRSVVLIAVEPDHVPRLMDALGELPEAKAADWTHHVDLSGEKGELTAAAEAFRQARQGEESASGQ